MHDSDVEFILTLYKTFRLWKYVTWATHEKIGNTALENNLLQNEALKSWPTSKTCKHALVYIKMISQFVFRAQVRKLKKV